MVLLNYREQEKVAHVSAQSGNVKPKDASNIVADGSDENLCGDGP